LARPEIVIASGLNRTEESLAVHRLRWVVPFLGLLVLASMTLIYVVDRPVYYRIMVFEMLGPYRFPFIDGAQMPAVIRCWQQGVDVYVTSLPCDLADRPFAYSPLWLRATFLSFDMSWRNWLGLTVDAAFFLSLALLPAPRRAGALIVLIIAVFSSLPSFALERANIDVVMFILAALGGRVFCAASPARFGSYPILTLAGLLKFYPLVLFLLFLRERLVAFFVLCGLGFISLLVFFLCFRGELAEMARNLPDISYYTDSFGAWQIPVGLARQSIDAAHLLGYESDVLTGLRDDKLLSAITFIFLLAACLAIAARLATRGGFGAALETLRRDEHAFLVIGAALLCGCFFAGQSSAYRGIHLVFVIPGLVVLATERMAGRSWTLFRVTLDIVLVILWGPTIEQVAAALSGGWSAPMSGSLVMYLYWVAHGLMWWWIATVLLAVLFCFIARSPAWQLLVLRRGVRAKAA
jgi:hypothetical protein